MAYGELVKVHVKWCILSCFSDASSGTDVPLPNRPQHAWSSSDSRSCWWYDSAIWYGRLPCERYSLIACCPNWDSDFCPRKCYSWAAKNGMSLVGVQVISLCRPSCLYLLHCVQLIGSLSILTFCNKYKFTWIWTMVSASANSFVGLRRLQPLHCCFCSTAIFFFSYLQPFFHVDTWWKPIPTGWATGTKPSGQGHRNAFGDGSDWGSPPARVPWGSQVQGCWGNGRSPQRSPSAESKHPNQSACCVITDRRHYLLTWKS